MVLELDVFGISRKLLVPSITLCKKIKIKINFSAQGLPKIQSTIIWLIGILRIKKTHFRHCCLLEVNKSCEYIYFGAKFLC